VEKDTHRSALPTWIGQTSAADTAYQHHVNAAYLGRTGGWTAADVDYTHDAAAAARQWVEDRADEQYDYLMDQASRSSTYVDQYAQSQTKGDTHSSIARRKKGTSRFYPCTLWSILR